jgi:hypothetical protein
VELTNDINAMIIRRNVLGQKKRKNCDKGNLIMFIDMKNQIVVTLTKEGRR